MLEWKERPRSITLTANGVTADVWPIIDHAGRKIWTWTTRRDDTGVYTNKGGELTQDAACEAALRFMNV